MNSQINLGIGPYPNSRLVILFLIFITKRGTFMNKHSLLSVFSLIAASATHIAFADIQILVNGRAVDWSANADTANSNIANEKGEVTDKNALAKKIDASELHALQWSQYAPKSGDLEGLAALPDNEKADFYVGFMKQLQRMMPCGYAVNYCMIYIKHMKNKIRTYP